MTDDVGIKFLAIIHSRVALIDFDRKKVNLSHLYTKILYLSCAYLLEDKNDAKRLKTAHPFCLNEYSIDGQGVKVLLK